MTAAPPQLRSAVYEGMVLHHRTGADGGPGHRFRASLGMLLLDLDEVEAVTALHPLWRQDRPAAVRLGRRELPGDPAVPAATAMRAAATGLLGSAPDGPVAVLLHPRTWGWQFNPVTSAYCYGADGQVAAMVAEVTSTPWHERATYVVGAPGTHRVAKDLHVSPFLPLGLDYRIRYTAPGERLVLGIDAVQPDGAVVLRTALVLRRRPVSRRSLGRLLCRYPAMPMRVSAGIYRQAAQLRRAGAPVHPHPAATGRPLRDVRRARAGARQQRQAPEAAASGDAAVSPPVAAEATRRRDDVGEA